jgi:hypothetical protein
MVIPYSVIVERPSDVLIIPTIRPDVGRYLAKEKPAAVKEKYILYDVNPGEGFNLRRDVFMRVAVLVRQGEPASVLRVPYYRSSKFIIKFCYSLWLEY